MNFSRLAAKAKKEAALIQGRVAARLRKIELAKLLPWIKKEILLTWERIVSLRTMRFSADDPKLFWVSGLLFLIFQGVISAMLWRVDTSWHIFSHQISLSVDDFLVQRDNWGHEKIRFYLQHYWLDFIHPAVYATFFRCLLTQIQLSYPTKYVYHAMAFPFAAAIYDELENLCQLPLMAGWTESSLVFYVGAFSALAKWLLLLSTLLAAGHALSRMLWERALEP
jgi:hypothetical protein